MSKAIKKKLYANYAIAIPSEYSEELTFIRFDTTDEDRALKLAGCVIGRDYARLAMIVVDDNDEIFAI